MEWVDQAKCLEEDPELFFPIGSTGPAALQTQIAKSVCSACTVRDACLEWALDTGQDSGVWGGLAEEERRTIRRARRRQSMAPAAAIAG